MSAAANAAAYLSLRGRLHPGPAQAPREAAAPRAAAATGPRPAPREETAPAPKIVRVTYRRGRLDLRQTRTSP